MNPWLAAGAIVAAAIFTVVTVAVLTVASWDSVEVNGDLTTRTHK